MASLTQLSCAAACFVAGAALLAACGKAPSSRMDAGGPAPPRPDAGGDAPARVDVAPDSPAGGADARQAGSDEPPAGDAPPARDGAGDPRRDVATGPYRAVAIATGLFHACALLDDGSVKCWGYNTAGQLGYGDTFRRGGDPNDMGDALPLVDLGGRAATSIAAGGNATCAILDDGAVKCWGDGAIVGLPGGTQNRGDQPGEMGDALPALDLGAERRARLVTVGVSVACALLDDATVSCWGKDAPAPTPTPVALRSTVTVSALAAGERGMLVLHTDGTVERLLAPAFLPPLLESTERATALAGSSTQDCAIVNGGVVGCADPVFGRGTLDGTDSFFHYGLVRTDGGAADYVGPASLPRLTAIGQLWFPALCAIYDDQRVGCQAFMTDWPCTPDWCVPSTLPGDGTIFIQLGHPAAALTTGGQEHMCALTTNGEVRCWGGPYMPTSPTDSLGSSFDFVEKNGTFSYGPFHSINLGNHH